MKTLLTESNLLASLTASQLADIRKQAPAGEDPVADNMLSAAADQRTAYDAALKALQEVRDGTFPFPSSCGKKSGAIAYGSNRKII